MLQSQAQHRISMRISAVEAEILDDIEEIGFGELYDIGTSEGSLSLLRALSFRQQQFICILRRERHFDKIVIHESEPQYAIKNSKTGNERPCQIKYKF